MALLFTFTLNWEITLSFSWINIELCSKRAISSTQNGEKEAAKVKQLNSIIWRYFKCFITYKNIFSTFRINVFNQAMNLGFMVRQKFFRIKGQAVSPKNLNYVKAPDKPPFKKFYNCPIVIKVFFWCIFIKIQSN